MAAAPPSQFEQQIMSGLNTMWQKLNTLEQMSQATIARLGELQTTVQRLSIERTAAAANATTTQNPAQQPPMLSLPSSGQMQSVPPFSF
jgi:hypothetical protein